MKKIVNGRLYDTGEAVTVCSWRETGSMFGVEIEAKFTLCREKAVEKPAERLKLGSWGNVYCDLDMGDDCSEGDFFLAVQVGGELGKGRIRPLGVDEARRIFEEHSDSSYNLEDEYQKYFGVRPQKPILSQLKEAFQAGAGAKQKQYEEEAKKAEAAKDAE